MSKSLIKQKTYIQLFNMIKKEIGEGKMRAQSAVQTEKLATYWRVGELISRHLLEHKDITGYEEKLFERLCEDLNITQDLLHHMKEFYNSCPEFPVQEK